MPIRGDKGQNYVGKIPNRMQTSVLEMLKCPVLHIAAADYTEQLVMA
jgi:hypothetical protein